MRTKQFTDALKDGAFDFILSLSADVKSIEWVEPARHGLRQWLQRKSPALLPDSIPFSAYFQTALMEHLESFIDAFITHMPDVLRKLRIDEDEQRQLSLTHDHDLDLERFLIIISFAFEGRPDAAQAFWSDPDSNLAGFLHWASRRTTTPLLSAFCEMLQTLSEDEYCATKAHEFLLGERVSASGKMMRSHSLTWDKIFRELIFYSSNLRERPSLPQSTFYRNSKQNHDQVEAEPESAMMLESYLRLMTRLCTESIFPRTFLFENSAFSITDLLYQLASSENVPSRLRASAFDTLRSLLSHKTRDRGEFMWKALDSWVSGSYSSTLVPRTTAPISASAGAMNSILERLIAGSEDCNAFVMLLKALVAPYEDGAGLDDTLPFPELLGSSYRMPGIDPYVDLIGQVFRSRQAETSDPVQLRLLSLSCLDFMATCLATFNEDLVIFANQSNIAVDNAIGASDLASYVRLHPFARVMEWIFNDGVMTALFATLHQDPTEVGKASPDSPIVICLMRAIHLVTLVMNLQSTYLDIVRPIIKLQATHQRYVVANAAFASFEDGVLNNLSIIADLGLYCGAGHAPLTMASLKLLELLSSSPKLVGAPSSGIGKYSGRNKAIAALEYNNDSERISRSLINELSSNIELDEGPESDAYMIKAHIIDFLNACLEAMPRSPSIAHAILGFQCGSDTIDVGHGSSFSNGASLFHSILRLAVEYPVGDHANGLLSWPISLKFKALQILKTLWSSPLSSNLVMGELQSADFMANMFVREVIVGPTTPWDGRTIEDAEFLSSSSSSGLFDFIRHRASLLQYTALEFRRITREKSPAVRDGTLTVVQGYTTSDDGQQIENPTIFDLFDFMELEIQDQVAAPHLAYFKDVDINVCSENLRDAPQTYDMVRLQELINLRHNELRNIGQLPTSTEESVFDREAQTLLISVGMENQSRRLDASRLKALESWVQVMIMIIGTKGLEGSKKTSFILQALQVILPKFEKYSLEALDEARMLANLAKTLLFSIDFTSQSFQEGDNGDLISDRLFQLFRVCLRAIYSPIANSALKETLYSICYRYLTGMSDVLKSSDMLRKHSTYTIKAAGERLMDVVCDDAYAGEQTCRISAVLFLSALVTMATQENSKYIVEALLRLNFIGLLVDSIKNILVELREHEGDGEFCFLFLCDLLTQYRPRLATFILSGKACSPT
jgi:nuclear pore complex protein Nup205